MAKKQSLGQFLDGVQPESLYRKLPQDNVIDAPSSVANYMYLLAALRSNAPGQWSANLLELSNHLLGPVYLAVNTMANQAAAADMKLYERTEDPLESDIELPYTEPVVRLLEDPNNDDSFGDLMYQTSQQIGLTGIGLIWKPPSGLGDVPSELYSIPTATALPWPPSPVYPHGSYLIQPYYPYGPFSTVPSYQSAAGARIPAEQIIRIKNPHPILRYSGYAVLTAMQRQVDTTDAIDISRWNTQQKGVDPTVAFNFDPELFNPESTDLNRLRMQLEALYSGPNNAGRIMFNPLGSTVTRISQTPQEMGWTEGYAQLLEFILAAYGVPKSVAGLQDAASFSTLYSALRQFYLISLNPHLKKISDKLTKALVKPYYGENLYMTLKGQRITDDDLLVKKFQTVLPYNVVRRNELRKWMDMGPIEGKEGDEFIGKEDAPTIRFADDNFVETSEGIPVADPAVEQARPNNPQGEGSLGPRKSYKPDRLATLLDRAKSNGHAKDYDQDQKSFLLNGRR